jgi:hypothetical protein
MVTFTIGLGYLYCDLNNIIKPILIIFPIKNLIHEITFKSNKGKMGQVDKKKSIFVNNLLYVVSE